MGPSRSLLPPSPPSWTEGGEKRALAHSGREGKKTEEEEEEGNEENDDDDAGGDDDDDDADDDDDDDDVVVFVVVVDSSIELRPTEADFFLKFLPNFDFFLKYRAR